MSKGNLNVEYASFVNTTFRPRDARLPKERLVSRDWTEGYPTQVFFLEVRDFAMDAFECCA
jgi:hypothetical protein